MNDIEIYYQIGTECMSLYPELDHIQNSFIHERDCILDS